MKYFRSNCVLDVLFGKFLSETGAFELFFNPQLRCEQVSSYKQHLGPVVVVLAF